MEVEQISFFLNSCQYNKRKLVKYLDSPQCKLNFDSNSLIAYTLGNKNTCIGIFSIYTLVKLLLNHNKFKYVFNK